MDVVAAGCPVVRRLDVTEAGCPVVRRAEVLVLSGGAEQLGDLVTPETAQFYFEVARAVSPGTGVVVGALHALVETAVGRCSGHPQGFAAGTLCQGSLPSAYWERDRQLTILFTE